MLQRLKHVLFPLTLTICGLTFGCGLDRFQTTPAAAIPNFTFEDLKKIQSDTTLTTDEKRAAIRTAIGAPETAEGDRLVDFLLNFQVP
jgi:hypothetical protein